MLAEMEDRSGLDKIDIVDDRRVKRCSAVVNGRTWGYLLAEPEGGYKDTLFLIHGFPDISSTWRYQIPLFLSMGLRVIAPDCMGYGQSDSPTDLKAFTGKSLASDLAALVTEHLGLSQIQLGGHDWGAFVAQRFYLFYPHLIKSLFTICVPYIAPNPRYIPLELATKKFPSLTYQIQFAQEGLVEGKISSKDEIRSFLKALYGGKGPNKEVGFIAEKGTQFENLPLLRPSPLLSEKELEFYVEQFARNGMRGPLSYYRTRKLNQEDELALFKTTDAGLTPPTIDIPYLFVLATEDVALRPEMAAGIEKVCKDLTIEKVKAGHWLLWERPSEANEILQRWFESKGFVVEGKGKL